MMLVRTDRGRLHIANPTGRGYLALCGHVFTNVEPVRRREARRAWQLELQCDRCAKHAR